MKAWRFLILTGTVVLASCGTVQNQYQLAEDDVYYSRKTNSSKPVIIPDPDLDRIMKEHPSRVDSTKPSNYYYDGVTPNPNAAIGYPAYRAYQDSLYEKHPELSSYYDDKQQPPFDLNEERKKQKAWARQQRRLARANRYSYSDNYYSTPYYGSSMGLGYTPYNYGWNRYSPGLNYGLGWNSWNGWGVGFGYNCNNWNSPWACNIYDPWCNSYGYGFNNPWYYNNWNNPWYQPYYYGNQSAEPADPNPPVSRPREMIGSGVPPSNATRSDGGGSPAPLRSDPAPRSDGRPGLRNENGNPRYVPPAGYEPRIMRETHPQYNGQIRQSPPPGQGSHNNTDNGVMQRQNIYQEANPNNNGQRLQEQPQNQFRSNERAPQQQQYNPSSPAPSAPSAPAAPRGGGSRSSGGSGGGSVSRPR